MAVMTRLEMSSEQLEYVWLESNCVDRPSATVTRNLLVMSPPRGSPAGLVLHVSAVTITQRFYRAAPYLRRVARYSLKGTMRIALKPFTRSISFWMADFQPKGAA